MKHVCISLLLALFSASLLLAQDAAETETEPNFEEIMAVYQAFADSFAQHVTFETGAVSLGEDLAKIQVPQGFKYLNPKDSETVLTDLWGNPPSEGENRSLGMLFPEKDHPMTDSSFAINITYSEEGYVDDEDADDIDYDELLETMQADTKASNEYREELGYGPIELVGWASTPFYDAANKKLHWAKEIKFGDSEENTLNYNIRVLGRKGFLQLNVISEMFMLDEVKQQIDPILDAVNFEEGNRYADFDPDVDKVAAYGIGALIAGKVMAKAGLFAKLGIFLAKGWKIIALAVVGLFAALKRFFGSKTKEE